MNQTTADPTASQRTPPAREFKALALALHVSLANVIKTLTPPVPVDDAEVTDEIEAIRRQGKLRVTIAEARKHIAANLSLEITDALVKGVAVPLNNIVDAQRHKSMRTRFGKLKMRAMPRPSLQTDALYSGGFCMHMHNTNGYSFEVGRLQMDHLPYTNCASAIDRAGKDRQVEFEPIGGVRTLSMNKWLNQRVFSILAKVGETQTTLTSVHIGNPQPSGYVCYFEYSVRDLIRIFRNTVAAHVDFVQPPKMMMMKRDLLLLALKERPSHFGKYINCLLLALGQEMMLALQQSGLRTLGSDALASFTCPVGAWSGTGRLECMTELFVVSGAPSELVEDFRWKWFTFREYMSLARG